MFIEQLTFNKKCFKMLDMSYIETKKLKIRAAEALREKLNKCDNISELSRKSGVSRTTIWNIQNGNFVASSATINKLEEALEELKK